MNRRRGRILALMILPWALIMMCGFGLFSKEVKLKNVNEPFVDLEKEVVRSAPGKDANAASSEVKAEGTDDKSKVIMDESDKQVVVSVRDTVVKLDGHVVKDVATLRTQLANRLKNERAIVLVDDYAESHTFKEVLAMLDDEQIQYSLKEEP